MLENDLPNTEKGHQKGHQTKKQNTEGQSLKIIILERNNYSKVRLYIPKKVVDGKKIPTVESGKRWYVYFYYTNLRTGKRKKFMYKKGINRFKTVKERKEYGKALVQAFTELLAEGFDPYGNSHMAKNKNRQSLRTAINEAYEKKSNHWRANTRATIGVHKNHFLNWAADNNLDKRDITKIEKKHITAFLDYVAKTSNNTSVNNYRSSLSVLFGKLENDDVITYNFIPGIPKLKTSPVRHKAFSDDQVNQIRSYLLEHDPYLYTFTQFITYAFLRNIEVARLNVGSVDLKNKLIYVKTKTNQLAKVPIIERLRPSLETMLLQENYPDNYSLFSPSGKPDLWAVSEKAKVDFFSKRFKKVKKHFGLDKNYTLYSFRHTFCLNLYHSFIKQGLTDREAVLKMLPITRHANENGLRNYLRGVGATTPKDYGDIYTIDY